MTTKDRKVAPHGGVLAMRTEAAASAAIGKALTVAGGDGQVTALHDGGGPVLQHTRIILIYWGNAWAAPATSPSHNDFTNTLSGIISGSWGTQLAQYRGIGPLSLEQVDLNTSSDPPTSFTDPEIWSMIDARITNGNVPAPSSSVDRIYCVLMPTGHSSGDTSFVGQHQANSHNGIPVYWAWVTNDGTLTGGNSIPKVFTHEVAEACSDPNLSTGITLTSVGEGDEIGDVCNNTFSTINGAAEEAYWSQVDRRCVLPTFQPFPAVAGNPVLIQSRFGSKGNFELVVPAAGGGLVHLWRNDDNPYLPWSGPTPFGQSLGAVDAVTMIQSNFGSPGNLEVIARVGSQLQFFWRDSGPAFNWNGPFLLLSTEW